jgi:hypothetical protein
MINTIGHLPWMKTHDLVGSKADPGYALTPVSQEANWSPFWVVRAAPTIINGHNGIFQPAFLRFVAGRLFEHVEYSRSKRPLRSMDQEK